MAQTLRARALLLDMDGTLVDSTAVVERLWLQWVEPHGLDPRRVLEVVHGRQGHQSMAILLPERDHAVNLAENDEMLARESGDVAGVVEIPGAGAFLASLRGLRHAIVTSANVPLMTARMRAAGLTVPVEHVTAEDVTASKPDPQGFLLGAERLGVSPADAIAFEDSAAGIAAARAAGMRVVGVGGASAAYSPDVVVPDLTSVEVAADGDDILLTVR